MEPPFKPEIGCGCDPLVSGAQVAPEMELLGTIAHYPLSYRSLGTFRKQRDFKMVVCSFVVLFGICFNYIVTTITHYPPSSRSLVPFRFTLMAPGF